MKRPMIFAALGLGLASCQETPAPDAAEYVVRAWQGRPILVQNPKPGLVTVSAASDSGEFSIASNCLVATVAEESWTPVFPGNVEFNERSSNIRLGGSVIEFGKRYSFENVVVNFPLSEPARQELASRGCPQSLVLFTDLQTPEGPALVP